MDASVAAQTLALHHSDARYHAEPQGRRYELTVQTSWTLTRDG